MTAAYKQQTGKVDTLIAQHKESYIKQYIIDRRAYNEMSEQASRIIAC